MDKKEKESKLKKERELAPLPAKLQEVLQEIAGIEEKESEIHEQAREITEILRSLEPSDEIERRIQTKLGEEMDQLGRMLVDNIDRIRILKEEEQSLLEEWSSREQAKAKTEVITGELELPESAASFFAMGEDENLLKRSEELKELYAATPEEARELMFGAAPALSKEGLEIEKEDLLLMREVQQAAAITEAKSYEAMAKKAEKEAVALEKQATFEEKMIEKQLKEWKKEGIDAEKDELTKMGNAKLALRKLFSKDFSATHSIYSSAKERSSRLREEATLARIGAEGRKSEAALLREAVKNGDLASATKTISSSMLRRAIRAASSMASTPSKIRSLFGLSG